MEKKGSIIFLAIPSSLKDKIHPLDLDPSILIPVELAPGQSAYDPENLSLETIISGMLRIISAGSEDIPDEWIDYYRNFVLSVKPEIYHEFTSAAIVKAKNGEYDMALEINGILEGLFPRSPGILLNKALILEDRAGSLEKNGHSPENEKNQALAAYELALSVKPVLPDTFFNAGFFFMGLRNFGRAKECFSHYVGLAKEEGDIPGDFPKEKIQQAEKIIRDINSQGLDNISFQEAYDLINNGQDQEGLIKIREFLEKHPRVRNGWFVLGWALRKLGRFADALESFKKAIELGGTDTDTQNEIAICHIELGDLKAAQRELEQALMEDPESVKIISNLGVLALKRGDKKEAEAFFRTVLSMDGDDPVAKKYLNS